MGWMLPEMPGDVQTVPRRLDLPPDKVIVDRADVPVAPVRWGQRHRALVIAALVLGWLLSMALAFEAGHAYAEGVRTLGGFADHLSEMVHHFTGGRFGSMHDVAGWMWRPRAVAGWMWLRP